MKNNILLVLLFTYGIAQAQFIKEKSINAQIGLGFSTSYNENSNVVNNGFFLQGELVLKAKSWFELRPYAGLILTNSNGKDLNNNPTDDKAESKALLIGGKARVRAPIPWFAPYFEIGLGASVGKFESRTFNNSFKKSGIIYHIPLSLGVQLGRKNNVDMGLTYYFQPSVEQFIGALAVGVSIPLKNNN